MALVRLYPYNKRLGWVMRTFSIADGRRSVKFSSDRGWYRVDDDTPDGKELLKKLAAVKQQDRLPDGPAAFMIAADVDEARRMDDKLDELQNRDRDESVGTVTAPVQLVRPGTQERSTRTRRRSARSSEASAD